MGKKPFHLETVLSYRKSLVELRETELATALRHQRHAEEVLQALQGEWAHTLASVRALKAAQRLDQAGLLAAESYLTQLEAELTRQMLIVQELTQQIQACRTALNEALKEKKKIERLKERLQQLWAQEEARAEQVLIDDLNTIRYPRRKVM
ncbi:MAG: flagellar export protein FliJ [Anaerolineae bacterium]|nr:flagellar export protein FliJ [Anaerolineae bacterium]MDW8099718.1 flagellar export protein FliJ [Anaerolineae bacterium]